MSSLLDCVPSRLLRVFAVVMATACAACQATEPVKAAGSTPALGRDVAQEDVFREFSLTIYGYNYTDTEIGSFQVNGRGGGNVEVSTPSAGGGKFVCCTPLFTPLPPHRIINVKWTRDAVQWCEQDVPFTGPVPLGARYLEVHFMPDGRIQIAASVTASPPRLVLERHHPNSRHVDRSANANNDFVHSRCHRGSR